MPILDTPVVESVAGDAGKTASRLNRPPLTAKQQKVTDNLGQLLDVLPPRLQTCLEREERRLQRLRSLNVIR